MWVIIILVSLSLSHCLPHSLVLSLSPSLLGFISGPAQCPTVMSWCDLCHRLWSLLISLLFKYGPTSTVSPSLFCCTSACLPPSQPAWLLWCCDGGFLSKSGRVLKRCDGRDISAQTSTCLVDYKYFSDHQNGPCPWTAHAKKLDCRFKSHRDPLSKHQ